MTYYYDGSLNRLEDWKGAVYSIDFKRGEIELLQFNNNSDMPYPIVTFDEIETYFESRNIYCLLRNISKLESKEFEMQIDESEGKTMEEIESHVINSALEQKAISLDEKERLTVLMKTMDTEKIEGETNDTFATRITNDLVAILDLKEIWS